jgi:cyclomaltodextrinase / maltogenic alpha-amylase / neopullulanase
MNRESVKGIIHMKSVRLLFAAGMAVVLLFTGCRHSAKATAFGDVPEWSKHAIWYQIFVERFRNGDKSNDPTPEDMAGAYPGSLPASWAVTPWGHDWYSHEPWLDSVKADGFYSKIQARRYGGDLQGVLDKIDYIKSLGVTAIYFNPLNDSPSLHKYDAANYIHIDRNFGPDPKGDVAIMRSEVPSDPSTWKWTAADKLFLRVISEFHKRGIKVIMDYSWNHTGRNFWALKDIREKGAKSEFKEWYNIISYDDPSTPQDEFRYQGWGGSNPWMPVFRKDIVPPDRKVMPFEGNLHSESLKQHIFSVTKRWLDPDGNGDPSDGVDGFRLDVAGEIPMGFWRDYRKVVRAVNPDAYLVGEIWWLEWPDKLLNPAVFLQGDQFDAIMNYRWFRVARGFFGQAEPVLSATGFVNEINRLDNGISNGCLLAMMNVTSTHDSPRLSTSLYNKSMDKYNATPNANPDYKINKPDAFTIREQVLLLVHQFTFPGAPQIWNGEELGMWGADDPDCRKPIIWDDIRFEIEKAAFDPHKSRQADTVRQDTALLSTYKSLCRLRNDNPVLATGDLTFTLADDSKMVLSYSRKLGNDEIIAVFNRSLKPQEVIVPAVPGRKYRQLFPAGKAVFGCADNGIKLSIPPVSALVLLKE